MKDILEIKEKIISLEKSEEYFERLLKEVEWERDKYNFHGKEVLSPREVSYYGEKNYTYTGQTKNKKKYIKIISELQEIVEKELDLKKDYFNGCLLNHYRNGKDYMGYHTDNEKEMVEDIIVALSFGETRKFYLKNNSTKEVIKNKIETGSLLIMYPKCQKEYQHSIPKELKIDKPRISLTFRRFK